MIYQRIAQRQQVKILPQQIQLLNLFHLTSLELEHRIQQELEENPLLEIKSEENNSDPNGEPVQEFADWDEFSYDDIPDYKTEYANYFSNEQAPDKPLMQAPDFREQLKEQCHLILSSEEENSLAAYIIDSLNENGMLEQEPSAIAEDISFKFNKWIEPFQLEKILFTIQSLDPPGIGARNIRECLLLQLQRKNQNSPHIKSAVKIIKEHYEDLRSRQIDKIIHSLNLSEQEFRDALKLISLLQLKPVTFKTEDAAAKNYIIPDFIITAEDGKIEVALSKQRSALLCINHTWMHLVKNQCCQNDKAANQYLKSKLQAAEWFVSSLQQRETNMLRIMKAIVKWQYKFFKEGDKLLLKPMILKNIAKETGVDISTVSRITCNKYAETPFGNILLKDLFCEGLCTEQGEIVSSRVIQYELKEAVSKEDKKSPFTDHQLVAVLAKKGYKIARRTVAKYRELLNIPAAQMRALWA